MEVHCIALEPGCEETMAVYGHAAMWQHRDTRLTYHREATIVVRHGPIITVGVPCQGNTQNCDHATNADRPIGLRLLSADTDVFRDAPSVKEVPPVRTPTTFPVATLIRGEPDEPPMVAPVVHVT